MKLLATFKPQDVEPDAPHFDYESFRPRTAARAVIFDRDKVALIYISEHGYYMLPGGGIDDNDIEAGLAREIREELGCEIEVTGEVGSAEVYFDRWQQKQTDYCYVARKTSASKDVSPTNFEVEEGHEVVWVSNLQEAIRLVKNASPVNRDGKLVRARDLTFLESVQQMSIKQITD